MSRVMRTANSTTSIATALDRIAEKVAELDIPLAGTPKPVVNPLLASAQRRMAAKRQILSNPEAMASIVESMAVDAAYAAATKAAFASLVAKLAEK